MTSMLSAASTPVVRATLPVVGAHLEVIADVFYDTMLTENPGLMNLFSRSAQASGEQRQALAGAVAAFGAHLVGLGPDAVILDRIVERIAQRHCALGVRPEQYALVGKYLLAAVGTVLGDAVTPEIAAAWDEVYWLFAVRLIGREARLYAEAGVESGSPWRTFVVARKIREAEDAVSFILTPADGQRTPRFRPGQYVSVAVDLPDGGRQLRQYSLSQAESGGSLRITVRRVRGVDGRPDGLVSGFLHDQVGVGDGLELSAAYGDLSLSPTAAPLLLVSAGVGITPMAAIMDHVARTEPNREVVAVHADRNHSRHPLFGDVAGSGSRLRSFRHIVWYEECAELHGGRGAPPVPEAHEVRIGRVDPDSIPVSPDAEVYLCGPIQFMQAIRSGLHRRGVPEERIHYEVFGADQWRSGSTDVVSPSVDSVV